MTDNLRFPAYSDYLRWPSEPVIGNFIYVDDTSKTTPNRRSFIFDQFTDFSASASSSGSQTIAKDMNTYLRLNLQVLLSLQDRKKYYLDLIRIKFK